MDDAMIAKLLSTYNGAQPTVQNINAARQFFAANPQVAEHRAMGMRGSVQDDNSDLFQAQLDKFMQASEKEAPAGKAEVGPIQQVAAPTQQTAPAPRQAAKPASPMGPNLPMASGMVNPLDGPASATPPNSGSIWDWLLPAILGGGAVFAGDRLTRPRGEGEPAPKQKALPRAVGEDGKLLENPYPDGQKRLTYQPKLEDNVSDLSRVKTNEPAPTKVTGDPGLESEGKKAQIQAEVEADNAAAKRLEDQIMKQRQAQMETKKLSDAAKRAVGRR